MSFPRSIFTGFPFDDIEAPSDDRHRSSIDGQFADIVRRHPELAEHLNAPSFRTRSSSNSSFSPRTGRSTARSHHPHFQKFFDDFDFDPDGAHFEDSPENYFNKPPKPPTTGFAPHHQPHHQQRHETHQSKPTGNAEEGEQKSEPFRVGARKNIQQSNTADLGQRQEPVEDDRSQRSMSAPPENNRAPPPDSGKRYKSGITIPVNVASPGGPGAGGAMGSAQSNNNNERTQQGAEQQPLKPNERIIPIHIEGRDDPIIPKNVNINPSSNAPSNQEYFGRTANDFSRFVPKDTSFAEQQAQRKQADQQKYQEHLMRQQQQQNNASKQQEYKPQSHQQQQHAPEQPQQQEETVKAPTPRLTPLDHIKNIQKAVSDLMEQVEKFDGKSKDKQYLYLDEMLTRELIKLDNIDTEGKDSLRQARKEAVNCIQQCIKILENKATSQSREQGNEGPVEGANSDLPAAVVEENQKQAIQNAEDTETTTKTAVDQKEGQSAEAAAPSEATPASEDLATASSNASQECKNVVEEEKEKSAAEHVETKKEPKSNIKKK